jgi:filamentous hemagglutinin
VKKEELSNTTLLTTTLYVGAIELQIAGTTRITSSYYFAGAQLVAMREMTNTGSVTNTLYFLHTDHLGSNSITTNASGAVLARQSFMPFGSVRSGGTGVMPTDIGYTGQRLDAGTGGLMYYGARYYLPGLARFASADTLVPEPLDPQSWNRYSYTRNNPINRVDPSGHCDGQPGEYCEEMYPDPAEGEPSSDDDDYYKYLNCQDITLCPNPILVLEPNYVGLELVPLQPSLGLPFILMAKSGKQQENDESKGSGGGGGGGGDRRRYWKDVTEVEGRRVYQRNDLIDPNKADKAGTTNLERMQGGKPPIGPDGKPINLHHMTQAGDSPLAEVSQTFHQENKRTLHINPPSIPSGVDRQEFAAFRVVYWILRALGFKK